MPKRNKKHPKSKKPVKHHVIAEIAPTAIPARVFTKEPVVVVALPKSAWQKFLDVFLG
jgi:hypothetical protein